MGTSTSLTVSGDYAYIGLRSNSGAMYFTSISISWRTGTPDTYSSYCTTVAADTRKDAGLSFSEAAVTTEMKDSYAGQALTNPYSLSPIIWTSSNEAVATVGDNGTVSVHAVGETTITAMFNGNSEYKQSTVSYTLAVQDSRLAPGYSFSASEAVAPLGAAFTAPTFSNPNNVVVTFESTDASVATIDQEGNVTILAAGKTTIKARSDATDTYLAGEASYVLTVEETAIGRFVKVTSTGDITNGQYLIVYEEGSVALDGRLETLDAANNNVEVVIDRNEIKATSTLASAAFSIDVEAGTLQSASGKYIGVSSNSNGLKQTDDATAYTHSFSIDDEGDAVISAVFEGSNMTLRFNNESGQNSFRYYGSGQKAVQLYKFVADAASASVSITAAGYATYCAERALDFSGTAIKAFKAKVSGGAVSFTEVKQVPAGQGVLLKGDEGTYTVPVAAYAAPLSDNAFIGVTEQKTVDAPIYVLLNGGEGLGFYKTTQAFTVGAHTAYIPAPAGARSFISLAEATAIEGVAAGKAGGIVYNLQGQRAAKAQKGLYIVDGKKVMVK